MLKWWLLYSFLKWFLRWYTWWWQRWSCPNILIRVPRLNLKKIISPMITNIFDKSYQWQAIYFEFWYFVLMLNIYVLQVKCSCGRKKLLVLMKPNPAKIYKKSPKLTNIDIKNTTINSYWHQNHQSVQPLTKQITKPSKNIHIKVIDPPNINTKITTPYKYWHRSNQYWPNPADQNLI